MPKNKIYIWPALIIAFGLITAVFLYRYMDSFNTCMRVTGAANEERSDISKIEYCTRLNNSGFR